MQPRIGWPKPEKHPTAIRLPVLGNPVGAWAPTSRSRRRMGRWRTASLITVNLLIVAHIIHSQFADRTLGSVQLSDAMHTLELGEINPGFLLFAVAILATSVFGRVFCGWACHMGALQDLCAWLLKKAGIRPTPLRSRVLGYLPLLLALYMFVWPIFKRALLLPMLRAHWPWAAGVLKPVADFPGLSMTLTTDNLFARLPGAFIAVPFLLVCGCATVYFLGARGLCRYGCPYGGFLTAASSLAPVGIVVDASKCDGCGRCTAACSQHVRVLEETQAYGAVIDQSCVRSLDCIDACPHAALAFRFGKPALSRRARSPGGTSPSRALVWSDELALLVVFGFTFVTVRGLYGLIPMLMAVGVALCVCGAYWQCLRLHRDPDVSFRRLQFKRSGLFRPCGRFYLAACTLAGVLLLHSAVVRVILWRGSMLDDQITVTHDAALRGDVSSHSKTLAIRALSAYRAGSSWHAGGIALADTNWVNVRMAWLHIVTGDFEAAQVVLAKHMRRSASSDAMCVEIVTLKLAQGETLGAGQWLSSSISNSPSPMPRSARLLAQLHVQAGDDRTAESLLRTAVERWPSDASSRAMLGEFLMLGSQSQHAAAELGRAASLAPRDARIARMQAHACWSSGDLEAALAALRRSARLDRRGAMQDADVGAGWLDIAGRADEAERWRSAAKLGNGPPERTDH